MNKKGFITHTDPPMFLGGLWDVGQALRWEESYNFKRTPELLLTGESENVEWSVIAYTPSEGVRVPIYLVHIRCRNHVWQTGAGLNIEDCLEGLERRVDLFDRNQRLLDSEDIII